MSSAIDTAKENGISDQGRVQLLDLLEEVSDVLRLRLGKGPQTNVEPMVFELHEDARPVRPALRKHTPPKCAFMECTVKKLVEFGFVRLSKDADWGSAPLYRTEGTTRKLPADHRLARPVNAASKPITWPNPNIESEIGDLRTSLCFPSIDLVSGYWQLPLAEKSQKLHTFMTTKEYFMPIRTLQGSRNSGANFQSKVEPCFNNIRHTFKALLDDFALHAPNEAELLNVLRTFLQPCKVRNLVSLKKSTFFSKELRWCGRVLDGEVVRLAPRRLSGLLNVAKPEKVTELCEYLHCVTWMFTAIPDFTEQVATLRTLLEEAHRPSGSRKKRSIQKYSVTSLGWGMNTTWHSSASRSS